MIVRHGGARYKPPGPAPWHATVGSADALRLHTEALDVGREAAPQVLLLEAEVVEVVAQSAVPVAAVTVEVPAQRALRRGRERLACEGVDALEHRPLVGHEVLEPDVHGLVGRQEV